MWSRFRTGTTPDPVATPLRWTFSWPTIRRSLLVGAVVGTVLNMINQGEYITGDGAVDWFKLGLTYCVPCCVATFGAYSAARVISRQAHVRRGKLESR